MTEPWFDLIGFGAWYGGIGGGLLGTLGETLGCATGMAVLKGEGRAFILGAFSLMTPIGVGHLVVGLYAVFTGQP